MHSGVAMVAPGLRPKLRRSLSLTLVVLYGLGVTIGAGIYALVGQVAADAGPYAPLSFVIAGLVMIGPAAAYAELSGRMPFSAGQVHYVEEGLRWPLLGFIAGLAVTFIAVISAAAIALGAAGYLRAIVDLPQHALIAGVVLAMGGIAAIGIKESMIVAGLFTVIEILGLLAVIGGGFFGVPHALESALGAMTRIPETSAWPGIFSASLLGFFAFIGFENIVNMAEETHEPQKTLARAIFITLGLSTLLYVAVVLVCVIAVPLPELAGHEAPLALVFARVTGISPLGITLIAIVATLNGVIAQIVMASRILYGLAERGHIPELWGRVHAATRTPLIATLAITAAVLVLALAFPIAALAAWTSRVTLAVILLVCLSLTVIKLRRVAAPPGTFIVPIWLPIFGMLSAAFLLIAGGV